MTRLKCAICGKPIPNDKLKFQGKMPVHPGKCYDKAYYLRSDVRF